MAAPVSSEQSISIGLTSATTGFEISAFVRTSLAFFTLQRIQYNVELRVRENLKQYHAWEYQL